MIVAEGIIDIMLTHNRSPREEFYSKSSLCRQGQAGNSPIEPIRNDPIVNTAVRQDNKDRQQQLKSNIRVCGGVKVKVATIVVSIQEVKLVMFFKEQ